jgi:hypothetical protein
LVFVSPWAWRRGANSREKKKRRDIRVNYVNEGFDHSKVYNTLTVQFG